MEQVAHGKACANIFCRVNFSAWIERYGPFVYHCCGQGYVSGNDQVGRLYSAGNMLIGRIKLPATRMTVMSDDGGVASARLATR